MPKAKTSSSRARAARARGPSSGERLVRRDLGGGFARDPQSSFPDTATVDLMYFYANDEAPGVAYADHIFRVNSVYDPDYSLTGHQPRDFDTWATVYNRYKVVEVMADVTVSTNNTTPLTAWAISGASPTSLTSGDYPPELPRAIRLGCTSNGAPPIQVSFKVDMAALAGVSRARYLADDVYGSLVNGNPGSPLYTHVYIEEINQTQAVSVHIAVRLRMRTLFYSRAYTSPSAMITALRNPAPPPAQSASAAAAAAAGQRAPATRDDTDDGVVVSVSTLARALSTVTGRR